MLHKHDDGVIHDDFGFFTIEGEVVNHRHDPGSGEPIKTDIRPDDLWKWGKYPGRYTCEYCGEPHEPRECCQCGAPAIASGRFGHLCSDHGYEAYEDERADRC